MELAKKLFKGDRVIWVLYAFLSLISLLEVFSATSTLAYKQPYFWQPIGRHIVFLMLGFFIVLLVHNIPYRFFKILTPFMLVCFILLIVTPFIGVEHNGAKRWLSVGFMEFQPSELAKLCIIGYTAFFLSYIDRIGEKSAFWWIIGGGSPVFLLIAHDNGSTAILVLAVIYLMMFIGKISWKRMFKLSGVLFVLLILLVSFLFFSPESFVSKLGSRASTWKARFENFTRHGAAGANENQPLKITNENFQVVQAKIAIARGGISPRLPGNGQQRDFLPQAYSDFIYAIIIEELGLAGGILVMVAYLIFLVRIGVLMRHCEDKKFPKLLLAGCGMLIVFQAMTNMAVAVNLIPVTGQPLPLVSRGGTSTLISCAYIGIILSISRFAADIHNEPVEFEIEETEMTSMASVLDQAIPLDEERLKIKEL